MKKYQRYVWLPVPLVMVFLLLSPWMVMAAEPTLGEITTRLQQTYEATVSFTARFNQKTVLGFNQRAREGQGTVSIEKSGRMRWDYAEPETQVLVCDGQIFAMYVAREKQMIVGDARNYLESDITYAFLSGTGKLERDFVVEAMAATTTGGEVDKQVYHLKLTPKKAHPQVNFLEIWVNSKTYLVDRLQLVDHFGSVTDLVFSDIRINQAMPADFFSFTPPAGTEIIEQ